MDVAQFRIPKGLMNEVERLVDRGFYSNKSDVIRDALRRLILENQIGSVQNKNNSVDEIKNARKHLSKNISKKELQKINNSGK